MFGIHWSKGKRPVAVCGNSDGDLEMLHSSAPHPGRSLQVLIHHTDATREWTYDRDSHVGRLDDGLEAAREGGWVLVDMKQDRGRVYRFTEQNK